MVGWIILGVIVLIIVGINLIRIGVDAAFEDEQLRVSAKVAGVSLQLYPKEEKDEKPKKEKKPKKKRKKKDKSEKPDGETEEKKKKGLPLGMNREELFEAVKAVLHHLGRFPRKFLVERFKLHVRVAGVDPYNTAMGYAYLNEALSILLPMARNSFRVRRSDVRTDVDFTTDEIKVDFALAMSIRIGQIVGLLLAIAFAGARVVIRSKRRQKKEAKAAEKSSEAIPETNEIKINTTESETEKQAEERKDTHG